MEKNKETKKALKKKVPKLNLSLQNVIIIIFLISYIIIFYTYKHDIDQYKNIVDQYKNIVENPQKLCYIYYGSLIESNQQSPQKNLSEIFDDMFISVQVPEQEAPEQKVPEQKVPKQNVPG